MKTIFWQLKNYPLKSFEPGNGILVIRQNILLNHEVEIEGKLLKIRMIVEKGVIVEAEIGGVHFSAMQTKLIQKNLLQKGHDFNEIRNVLSDSENQIIHFFF
jgi:hypothetical protein